MRLTFRVLLIAAVIAGFGFGVSFGVGYAAGRGNPKQAAGGMTQQQINQLFGIQSGGLTTGAGGGTTPNGGGTATARGGTGTGTVARAPLGKITAIDGGTLTVETRVGGVQRVNLSPSTAVNRITSGSQGDLKVGDNIVATGTAKPDGSNFDATTVSQVPAELAQP
jgi:hypothetical protein